MNRQTEQEHKMSALARQLRQLPPTRPRTELQRWYLAVDGNQHRADLQADTPQQQDFMLCEALLPQIRTLACLIAAERHNFEQHSPEVFTEEADWFAARILVLGVRVFHLDITLIPMLQTANHRAAEYARKHNLPFTPAQMRMSLHASRPNGGLILENACFADADLGIIGNSLQLSHSLPNLITG